MLIMKWSRVGEAEVTLDVERVGPNDFEVKLTIPQAQSLAVDILAAHPLERVEPATLRDWKADATRYLRDSNMMTRRFARQVVGLVDGFDVLQLRVVAQEALLAELCKPAKTQESNDVEEKSPAVR